jgi:hypothetical protein
MLLVISLSNLKKAVEGGAASPEGEPADRGPR